MFAGDPDRQPHPLSPPRKLLLWLIVCGILLLASTAVVGVALTQQINRQRDIDQRICVAFNRFDAVFTRQLQQSARNLPKLAYFREHPLELIDQEEELQAQIREFVQRPC